MVGHISPSFGSRLIVDDGTRFKLEQIARKKNLRTPEEGRKYVDEMVEKYQKKCEQINDDSTVSIFVVDSDKPDSIFDFEYVSSKMIYQNKDGKLVPFIPHLPFVDKIKHKLSDTDYVRGLKQGVEYPSVEHVLRKAYELAQDVKDSTDYNFVPPVPTLFK